VRKEALTNKLLRESKRNKNNTNGIITIANIVSKVFRRKIQKRSEYYTVVPTTTMPRSKTSCQRKPSRIMLTYAD
jgi:hypothetical protein